ncbi:hypothetical protein Tco_0822111 [Tanacetum coccineum]|uniref:Uncharacterized protein n=1 Tax=Tanacetum coccineum TaxID=301880 RepID=A0ABQ5AH98_9ASTR
MLVRVSQHLKRNSLILSKRARLLITRLRILDLGFSLLELRDLPHKINQTVNDVVKEAVHIALQAPLQDCFRELPEADMKEILHQRMFESVDDVPILDDVNISDSEDTDTAHLPKIKTRPDWLKPVPEEDRPATPEPDWFQMEECYLLLTDQVDLDNPEGHRVGCPIFVVESGDRGRLVSVREVWPGWWISLGLLVDGQSSLFFSLCLTPRYSRSLVEEEIGMEIVTDLVGAFSEEAKGFAHSGSGVAGSVLALEQASAIWSRDLILGKMCSIGVLWESKILNHLV